MLFVLCMKCEGNKSTSPLREGVTLADMSGEEKNEEEKRTGDKRVQATDITLLGSWVSFNLQ